MRVRTHEGLFLVIAGLVVFLDRLTKLLAEALLAGKDVPIVPGWLDLALTYNTGGAFGLLKGIPMLFILASIAAICIITYFYGEIIVNKHYSWQLGLILGGAVGNLIDRLAFGRVVDFIAPSFWPAFNVADSALTIGVLAFVIWGMMKK